MLSHSVALLSSPYLSVSVDVAVRCSTRKVPTRNGSRSLEGTGQACDAQQPVEANFRKLDVYRTPQLC